MEEKNIYCNKCPFFSYSLGNKFEIDSNKKDWNLETLKKFSSFCIVTDENEDKFEKNNNCTDWQINKNNDYIISSGTNLTDILIFSNLVLNVKLKQKGKVIILLYFFSIRK